MPTVSRPAMLVLVAFAAFAACCCGPARPRPLEPELHVLQERVFDRHCATAGCHSGYFPESRLNLERGVSWKNLVGVRSVEDPGLLRVAPGNPDRSYLVRKLVGAGISGERMPSGRTPLSGGEIAAIRQWIERGAPDD